MPLRGWFCPPISVLHFPLRHSSKDTLISSTQSLGIVFPCVCFVSDQITNDSISRFHLVNYYNLTGFNRDREWAGCEMTFDSAREFLFENSNFTGCLFGGGNTETGSLAAGQNPSSCGLMQRCNCTVESTENATLAYFKSYSAMLKRDR